jgi:glycosyltransferase involved in cell wall biosynthesis
MYLSIIIPSFNESKTILKVLERVSAINFPVFVSQTELIVVDDCSTDDTQEIVEKAKYSYPNLSYYKQNTNQGKGSALKLGVEKSKGDVVLFQDADLELYPEDIPSMLQAMHDLNIDFINGSRYMTGIIRPSGSYFRYLGNKVFSFLTSSLINTHITDMACGYKMLKKELFLQINPQENRFGIEAELILKALKRNKRCIAEVPVRYLGRDKSDGKKLNSLDAIKILFSIFRISIFSK